MTRTVVIIGTLDTKGEEVEFVKEQIEKRGLKTIVIDTGTLTKALFSPDISRDEVAAAAGVDLERIVSLGEEGQMVAAMSQGLAKVTQQLCSEGKLDGIIALGGALGTALGLAAMKNLPLGIPKLMVSTMALTPFVNPERAHIDQIMMTTWADMWGLNRWTRGILERAGAAIAAMTEVYEREEPPQRPVVAITTLGGSWCKYVWYAKPLLEQRGYEVLVFHTTGAGGAAYEQLVEQGLINAALDLSVNELTGELLGGQYSAGSHRLDAAARKGIPQVVAPGAASSAGWEGAPESLPPPLKDHPVHVHAQKTLQIGLTEEEMAKAGELLAAKLNKTTGPTVLLIPTRGFTEFDRPGNSFYVPEGRKALIEAMKRRIKPEVKVVELDVHINDPEFAEQAVNILDDLIKANTEVGGPVRKEVG